MTALRHENPRPIPPDPREVAQIRAGDLVVDHRAQRDIDQDRVANIVNAFDWALFEAPTVVTVGDRIVVVEGQHRTKAVQALDPDMMLWCLILPNHLSTADQAQLGLDITANRRPHSAFDRWMNALHAEHPHEVLATDVLASHGLQLGRNKPSTMTISAAATIRRIVHGGGFSPEYGAEILDRTLCTVMDAWPTYDRESSITRWDRHVLLAVAAVHQMWDPSELDEGRLAEKIRIRPAAQWLSIGHGAEAGPPNAVIFAKVIEEYNRGLKARRLRLP